MMNAKKITKHDNIIRKNYALKSINDDKNECINDMLITSEV